jgi:hypothetical protein
MRLILLLSLFLLLSPVIASEAVDDLKRIEHELQAKADSLKTADLVSYSIYINAIKDLKKYTEDGDADGSRLLLKLETSVNMHKLFKAPTQIDKKTGDVAIAYDFFSFPAEIQDFDIGATAPDIKRGGLLVPIAQNITHKAVFVGKITVSGKIMQGNRQGVQFGLTNGLRLEGGSYNAWFINLTTPGSQKMQAKYNTDYTVSADPDFIPFSVEVNSQAIAVKWGEATTGTATPAAFMGSGILMGGSGGNIYKEVVISGTLDQNWIKHTLGIGAQ